MTLSLGIFWTECLNTVISYRSEGEQGALGCKFGDLNPDLESGTCRLCDLKQVTYLSEPLISLFMR